MHFAFRDARKGERRWWLVVENGEADLCRDDPGRELTVIVDSTVRSLTEVWTGDSDPAIEIAAGRLSVQGAGRHGARLWKWLGRSAFAPTRLAARTPGPTPFPTLKAWRVSARDSVSSR